MYDMLTHAGLPVTFVLLTSVLLNSGQRPPPFVGINNTPTPLQTPSTAVNQVFPESKSSNGNKTAAIIGTVVSGLIGLAVLIGATQINSPFKFEIINISQWQLYFLRFTLKCHVFTYSCFSVILSYLTPYLLEQPICVQSALQE